MNDDDIKREVLGDLMSKMREMDGSRFKPKAVEVEVSTMHPKEGESEPVMEGMSDDDSMGRLDHSEPDGDEFSPEDRGVLESLFGHGEDEEM